MLNFRPEFNVRAYRPYLAPKEDTSSSEAFAQVWRWISYFAWSFFIPGVLCLIANREFTPYFWFGGGLGIGAYYLASYIDPYAFLRSQGSFFIRMLVIFGLIAFQYVAWTQYFFYRDPERTTPANAAVVAPADGWVAYVRPIQGMRAPIAVKHKQTILLEEIMRWGTPMTFSNGMIIGISMTPMSVHVNRSPIAGQVVRHSYFPGKQMHSMLPMWLRTILGTPPYEDDSYHIVTNERETMLIEGDFPIFVTRIGDPWINKIETWKKDGEKVAQGERIGLIKMGSQTDLVFSTVTDKGSLKVVVEEGQYVYAGETVIARYETH